MTEREINFRTFNNYLTGLNAMFRWFVECGYHNENPFQHIKKKKTAIKRRMYLSDRERSILRDYLSVHKKEFLRIVLTSYYAILRRKEITMIRCGHVNLEKRLLFVPAENSKNKKDAYVSIPDALAKQLEELKPSSYPEDYYLFSDGTLKPGLKKIEPKWISDEWTKIRKELCFNNRIQFMSLRDTGIRQLLRDGVTIDDVMIHARHWSLEVTKTYLIHDTAECNWAIVKRAGEF
jgi:integrase